MIRGTLKYVALAVLALVTVGISLAALHRSVPEPTSGATTAASPFPSQSSTAAPPPQVLVFGDSYAGGTGASIPGSTGWVPLVAQAEGWQVTNVAQGGTGYVNAPTGADAKAGCGKDACENYSQVLAGLAATDPSPDIVLVSGGRNDATFTTQQFKNATTAFFQQLVTAFPAAKIVAVSPIWDDDPVPAAVAAEIRAVRNAAGNIGVTFIDIGEPLEGDPSLVAADGIHPSDAGHQAIATAVEDGLQAAGISAPVAASS